MRLIVLVPMLAVLSAASYWMLTRVQVPALEVETEVVTPEVEVSPVVVVPEGGVEIEYTTNTYPISGSTPEEVLASLRDYGPRSDGEWFFGLTQTEMDLTYRVADLEAGCGVVEANLSLGVVVTLPEWTVQADADRALVRDWRRFYRALSAHEENHREIAEDGADSLFRQFNGLRRDDCTILEAEIRHRLRSAQEDIKGAHRRYDARTGHGRTEGAVWPTR